MSNKIIAKVDGREIKEADLNALVQNLGQSAAYFQGEQGREKLIDELIMQELIYSDSIKRNIDKDEEFLAALEHVKKSLLQQYGLRKLFNTITMTDEDAVNYFEKNKERYELKEKVQASHILVDNEQVANDILSKINEGMSFEDAASNFSSCPSKQAGGDLGEFGKGQMVKEFEDAVFNMNVGEISKPIQTQFGYHIIKLAKHVKGEQATFEDVQEQVKKDYIMEKQDKLYNDTAKKLKEEYKVEIFA